VPHPTGTKVGASGKFTVTVSGTTLTWKLTFGHLSGSATAAHIHSGVKGKAGPVPVWEVAEAKARVGVEVSGPVTPLVGRERERDLLLSTFDRVRRESSTQLVTIAGVPGIGKSRLVAELYDQLEHEAELTNWRRGRSLPYGEGGALWAFGEMVKAQAGILESDTASDAERKLREAVAAALPEEDVEWVEARLRPLVGLSGETGARDESFAAWRRFVDALADQRPTVLVFEDLHWADDELLDFVDELVDWVENVPLLVLATARPELFDRRQEWGGGKRNALTVSLAPLADVETARLLAALLDQTLLPAEQQQELLARAGGNPLYAEQFARMFAERGDADGVLPETVQGIITARLDSLPPAEKALLLDAAVLGRTFWRGALDGDDVEARLRSLQRKEFIRRERRSAVAGENEYAFAHLLIRDVAYAQLPRAGRADKHVRAARWIDSLTGDRSADLAELRAHHYLAALELVEASGGDLRARRPCGGRAADAAQRALKLFAFSQVERYATRGLELVPDGDPRRRLRCSRSLPPKQSLAMLSSTSGRTRLPKVSSRSATSSPPLKRRRLQGTGSGTSATATVLAPPLSAPSICSSMCRSHVRSRQPSRLTRVC
jgi:predicted ATPase